MAATLRCLNNFNNEGWLFERDAWAPYELVNALVDTTISYQLMLVNGALHRRERLHKGDATLALPQP